MLARKVLKKLWVQKAAGGEAIFGPGRRATPLRSYRSTVQSEQLVCIWCNCIHVTLKTLQWRVAHSSVRFCTQSSDSLWMHLTSLLDSTGISFFFAIIWSDISPSLARCIERHPQLDHCHSLWNFDLWFRQEENMWTFSFHLFLLISEPALPFSQSV
jgi:hypothetical protein